MFWTLIPVIQIGYPVWLSNLQTENISKKKTKKKKKTRKYSFFNDYILALIFTFPTKKTFLIFEISSKIQLQDR
jgi:hypothetical protein